MPYIIVGTDLSDVSENAVQYAADVAAALDTDVVIVHAFSFPVMLGDVPIPASLINDTQDDAEKRLAALVEKLSAAYPNTGFKSHVAYGTIINVIEQYAAGHKKPRFTVMGNSNTTENSAWFFSTLKEATNGLSFPVLAIPPGATFTPNPKMCLAIDINRAGNAHVLNRLKILSIQLNAELHVLNVQEDTFNRDNISEINDEAKAALAAAKPHYHFLYEGNVDNTIRAFCKDNNINWLALIHGKYSFFEALFHNTHTKALATTIQIPLLILHEGSD